MEEILNTQEVRELYNAISVLKDEEEVSMFLRDLCTLTEIKAMAERLRVAKLVKKGRSYREICKTTGASTATVTRVAHWLNHGEGGYRLLLERIKM